MSTSNSNQHVTLKRDVGLFGGISVLAGIMIGSGIFYIGAIVLQRAGMSLGLALLVWAIGGLITLLSGICFAELGAMMPKAGGYYVYLREAYGQRVAFMCGFTNFFLSSSGSIAALAVAFAAAISSMTPLSEMEQKAVALGSILLLSAINIRGIRFGSFFQNTFMVLKMLPIILILVCGLVMGEQSPDLFTMPAETPSIGSILSMIAFAVLATLWAYEGWTNLNNIAEEIKDPKRNIPLALIGSILGVAVLYVLFNYAVYRVLPYDTIVSMVNDGNFYLGTAAAQSLFGSAGMIIVGSAMVLAIFNSLNGCITVFPRMYFAMARDGALFPSLAKLHPVYRTPINAPYKQSSPNAKEESGMKGAGTTAPVNPTEAGKAGEAIQQDQELMKAFLARAGKGEDRLADDFDFLKLKAMYVLLKDVGYTIRLKPMTDPPSPAYQRGDGQEAGSKIEPVPVTESAERSNAA